jgi:hypothetical protein
VAVVKLIRRCWAEFWLPAAVTDQQLMALCQLQPHHLIKLSLKLEQCNSQAIIYNKGRRLWHLRHCLPALCRVA